MNKLVLLASIPLGELVWVGDLLYEVTSSFHNVSVLTILPVQIF